MLIVVLIAVALSSLSHADPIVVEAESFDGLSVEGASSWMLEYYPDASMGKQIQTGGARACEVRRMIRLTPGDYFVWARCWNTRNANRSNALYLGGQGPFLFGDQEHEGNWWFKTGKVRLPERFEARIAIPQNRVGCVHKVDAIAFAQDENWDPNAPQALPPRADAFFSPPQWNDGQWFVTSRASWNTNISYLNPGEEPARDCTLRLEVPRGVEVEFGCMEKPWTAGDTLTRPDWWKGHQVSRETVEINGRSWTRCTLRFGPEFQMAPGWGTKEHNQFMWTRYYAPVTLFTRVDLSPGDYEFHTQFTTSQGESSPRTLRVTVLPSLPRRIAPAWAHIGMWEVWRESGQVDRNAVAKRYRTLAVTGFNEMHIVIPDQQTVALAARGGLRVLDSGQHPYRKESRQYLEASAVDSEGKRVPGHWCPTYLLTDESGAGESLDRVTALLRIGCSGLYLDWEGPGTWICYCQRCREAFLKETGLSELKWPEEVLPKGRCFEPQWVEFRIAQHNRIVGAIRKRLKAADPKAILGAYSGWSVRGLPPGHPEIQHYRYGYGVDVAKEVGALDFFAPGFYAYADGAVTGFVETLTRMRESIGKAPLAPYLCTEWLYGENEYWQRKTLYPFEVIRMEAGVALGFGCSGINIYSSLGYDGRFAGLVNRYAKLLSALGEAFIKADQINEAIEAKDFAGVALARKRDNKVWCVVTPAMAQTKSETVNLGLHGMTIRRATEVDNGRPLKVEAGRVSIDLPAHDFVICELECAGTATGR